MRVGVAYAWVSSRVPECACIFVRVCVGECSFIIQMLVWWLWRRDLLCHVTGVLLHTLGYERQGEGTGGREGGRKGTKGTSRVLCEEVVDRAIVGCREQRTGVIVKLLFIYLYCTYVRHSKAHTRRKGFLEWNNERWERF